MLTGFRPLLAVVCQDELCGGRPIQAGTLAMRQAGSRARVVGQTNSVEEVALLANRVGGTHVGLASLWSAHA